jgi:nitroimidazol reductase NimA-like FMN-containing flavoprotein (pyridoxamine 5'-phosphate oxidase superfamily)
VPVWYWWDGRSIYFASGERGQKVRNLARQPWVIVHAEDADDVIILEGPSVVVTDPAERARVNAAYMEKYVDPGSGARATIAPDTDVLYRVNVTHVMAWEYGTVAHRTDWHFSE